MNCWDVKCFVRVAPHSGREADPRYNTFLSQVGGTARADCRSQLENLQRQLLHLTAPQ